MIKAPAKKTSNVYTSFFNRAIAGFLLFDETLNLIDFNKMASRMLRIRRENALGMNLTKFSSSINGLDLHERFLKVVKTGRSMTLKNVATDISGGKRILNVHAFKAETGLGIVVVDMTRLNNVIDEFNLLLYKLSHDLRSPNSAIRGLVNAARLDVKEEYTFYEYLSLINKEAHKLDAILKELSRTVEIKVGTIVINRISVHEFAKEVIENLSGMPDFSNLKIDTNILSSRPFFCHKHALLTIFQNLIENAIKYRKKNATNSHLFITITDEKKGLQIIFKDNGIGIQNDTLPHIFKMFFRGTNQSKGAGLGLFTVRNSVRALKGKISVESKEGVGTCFTVYIPSAIDSGQNSEVSSVKSLTK
jgi:signal transduction histidine kinase